MSDLRCFSIPPCDLPLPTWSFEQVKAKDKEDEDIIFLALNEKVLRFDLQLTVKYAKIVRLNKGKQWAFQIVSKFRYDPHFGVPATYEDMTQEHRLYVEDTVLDSYLVGELKKRWSIVALLRQQPISASLIYGSLVTKHYFFNLKLINNLNIHNEKVSSMQM